MSTVIYYDPIDVIPGLVTKHIPSAADTTFHQGQASTLINPDLTGLYDHTARSYTVPMKYWKHSAGSVIQLTAAEKETRYLASRKIERNKEFESTSQARIILGHEFPQGSGQLFPLEDSSKTILLALLLGKDLTTYPVEMNLKDGKGTILLQANAARSVMGADSDGDVYYHSVEAALSAAKISIEHASQAGTSDLALTVTVVKKAIVVSFATDASSNDVIPTGAVIAAAVNGDTAAAALVTATALGTGLGLGRTANEDYLISAIDVVKFYANAMGTAKAWLDGETILKKAVAAATTLAAVDAVVDPR